VQKPQERESAFDLTASRSQMAQAPMLVS
jgi:hypothetical protein